MKEILSKTKNYLKSHYKKAIIIGLLAIVLVASIVIATCNSNGKEKTPQVNETYSLQDVGYLTDTSQTYVGWGTLKTNTNVEDGQISLLVDGERKYFETGYGAHATSQLTFDLSDYSAKYKRLTGYFGVDYTKGGNGDGVILTVYMSYDGVNYEKYVSSGVQKGNTEAYKIDLNLYGYNYIRLVADKNANDGYDHAVYADLQLNTIENDEELVAYSKIGSLVEYDTILSAKSVDYNYSKNYYNILKREFVKRVGYLTLQQAVKDDATMSAMLDWLIGTKNNYQNLSLFLEAGSMYNGSSLMTLTALNNLYKECKADLSGDVIYKKMMIATAVANCKSIASWVAAYGGDLTASDPVKKYIAMKNLYDSNYFVDKEAFASYPMELIRYVMDARLQDDEILWLNRYADYRYSTNLQKNSMDIVI